MKRHVYRERDYAFAQLVLTLRTTLGLTQVGLAEPLGVSRRAVAEWEMGLSYPKAERLKAFIELGVQASAFAAGREEEQIRALWKAAHQKVLLDEDWLRDLLAPPASLPLVPQGSPPVPHAGSKSAAFPRMDWVEALDTSHFAGREVEVAELSQWIVPERCRLVTLVGMGGIGKSMLASYLGLRLAKEFEAVLWRSVRDAPSCEELVADCITFFSETPPAAFPASLEQRITQLLSRLQARRCLLVLDNLETLLESGDREGNYLPGYEGYGRLIGRLAESAHQSCVLLTSREKPKEIEPLEGLRSPARSLRLAGMDEQADHAQSSGQGPGVVVRDIFEEGWRGCKSGLQVSTTGGPFFDENPRQGVYLQLPIPVPQMRSGLPRYVPPSAHDWGQVLMFQGKSCSHFRSFTRREGELP